jgi:hypothetical protein
MKIKLPQSAIDSGVMRVRLRRVPVHSNVIKAFLATGGPGTACEVAQGYIYGRGLGSPASESITIEFPLRLSVHTLAAGDVLELRVQKDDGGAPVPIDLDITSIS